MKPKRQDRNPVKLICARKLSVVWDEAQNPLNQRNVDQIVRDFCFEALGILTVTDELEGGTYHVIDGKHRLAALLKLFGSQPGEIKVSCQIIRGVTDPQRAAEIWLKMDNRSKPTAIQRFKLCLTAEEPEALVIERVITSLGYRIASDKSTGAFAAVVAARVIYRRYGEDGLLMAVATVKAAYGLNSMAVEANIVHGMAIFLHLYGKEIDRQSLVTRLSKRGAAGILIGDARTLRATNSNPMAQNVAECIRETYNRGRRTHRLAASE